MYIYYTIGNNSGPQTLVRIVEVSVIGGVHFWRFHCSSLQDVPTEPFFIPSVLYFAPYLPPKI